MPAGAKTVPTIKAEITVRIIILFVHMLKWVDTRQHQRAYLECFQKLYQRALVCVRQGGSKIMATILHKIRALADAK